MGLPARRTAIDSKRSFPADFISEALDQTRGWFYSLLAISTLLFGDERAGGDEAAAHPFPHPFRTCIVLGLMLAEWWESKQDGEGNGISARKRKRVSDVRPASTRTGSARCPRAAELPQPAGDLRPHGADALRWYFFANQPPWTSILYSERAIKESIPEFLLRLWNVYSFFVIYANIDGFDPGRVARRPGGPAGQPAVLAQADGYRPVSQRGELDRWVLSELHAHGRGRRASGWTPTTTTAPAHGLNAFVDALSNWYVRRSRDRFWSGDQQSADKLDAYWTLYECLLTVSKLIAPFVPFLAEAMWQNLAGVFGARAAESVHLCDYPLADPARDRRAAVRTDAAAARDRLAGPLGAHERQAEGAPAAVPGRGDPGRRRRIRPGWKSTRICSARS